MSSLEERVNKFHSDFNDYGNAECNLKKDVLLKTLIGGIVGAAAHGYYNKTNDRSLAEGLGRGSLFGSSIGAAVSF